MYAFLASSSWDTCKISSNKNSFEKKHMTELLNPPRLSKKTFATWTRSSRVGRVKEIKSTFVDKFKNNLCGAHCLFLMHSPLQLLFSSLFVSYFPSFVLSFHPQSLSFSRSTVAMVAEQKTFSSRAFLVRFFVLLLILSDSQCEC